MLLDRSATARWPSAIHGCSNGCGKRRTSAFQPPRGSSRSTLSAWPSGQRGDSRPTIPQLRKAAKLYKRPLAAFYLPEPPRDFTLPNDYRRVPDAEPGTYSPALLVAMRLADYRRSVALDLESQPPASEFVGTATMDEGAQILAARMRQMLGIPLEEQFGWRDEYKALNGWKNGD